MLPVWKKPRRRFLSACQEAYFPFPALQEQPASNPGLLVCGFSPDGSHIVAGSNDCHIYAWFWDIASAMDKGKGAAKQGTYNVCDEEEAARNLAPSVAQAPAAEGWPETQEVCRLGGHVNDVLLLQFSHDGTCVATGSKDGTVRVRERLSGGVLALCHVSHLTIALSLVS